MTGRHDLDQQLSAFLREGPTDLPDPSFDAVRDRVEQTRQRAVIGSVGVPDMNRFLAIGLSAAAALLAVFIGAQLFGLPSGGAGGPDDEGTAPPAPTATMEQGPSQAPSPSAAQTAVADFPVFPGPPQPVNAGTYHLGPDFPVSVSFVVPAGWLSCVNNARLLCLADGVGEVTIDIVTNVVADPCKTTLRDPSVGPTVDDLVTAISSLPWSAVTPPTDVTVEGIRGKEFEVTAPDGSACAGDAFAVWVATLNGRVHEVSPGDRNRLRILEVQGTRVVIAGSYRPGTTSSQDLAEINGIIDSVRIEPPGD